MAESEQETLVAVSGGHVVEGEQAYPIYRMAADWIEDGERDNDAWRERDKCRIGRDVRHVIELLEAMGN